MNTTKELRYALTNVNTPIDLLVQYQEKICNSHGWEVDWENDILTILKSVQEN